MQIPPVRIVFSEDDRKEILGKIDAALTQGKVAQGDNLKAFEAAFAAYCGAKHAVGVSSGGSALEVAMRLLGVKGKEVIVPTNTFAASATSVLMAGGDVKFADIDAATFSLSLAGIQAAFSPGKTAGVILVHIGGIITPEIEKIREWCDQKGVWLFEDAAHAHGSEWKGKRAGLFGKAAAYSFFATKVMTSGEGGMIVTNDDDLANKARGLRDYGKADPWVSFHTQIGSNWRMSEFCAIIGGVHLKRLDDFINWRGKITKIYTERLKGFSKLKLVLPADRSSWYKYIALLPAGLKSEAVKPKMKELGVSLAGGVYEMPLHQQPVFKDIASGRSFPVADDVCARHICLPLYYGMKDEEAEFVVQSLKTVLS